MVWKLQTILFPISSGDGWTLTSSKNYLIHNGYKHNKVDIKPGSGFIRYRQRKPPSSGAYYKTLTRFKDGKKIELVYYYSN